MVVGPNSQQMWRQSSYCEYGSYIVQLYRADPFCHSWSRRVGEYNGNMTPVPLSSHTFARVAPYARIPKIYARLLDYKAATYVFASPQLPPSLSHTSLKEVRNRYLSKRETHKIAKYAANTIL